MTYSQLLLALLAMYVSTFAPAEDSKPQQVSMNIDHKAVIVELFTSEGCSSCPPADNFLAQLSARQPIGDVEVIALEEHVDYWNHDGWFDPFSSAEWTLRQQDYAARLSESRTYTPQMIIDGQREIVGSREHDVQQAIQEAAHREKTRVVLRSETADGSRTKQFTVSVETLRGSFEQDNAEVWLAVTEGNLRSAVHSGENAGKDLPHSAVLRTLHKIGVVPPSQQPSMAFTASPQVKLKPEWKQQNLRFVVFVQEKKSRRILGAANIGTEK
jgi:hypothetical protein